MPEAARARHPAPVVRAVLYLRQSTHKEESLSLEMQETAGREYCRQHGYAVVAVKSDPGISGRTWNRPAVREVMSMIETHDVDVIVLWKWSRLSRRRLDWAVAVDRVEMAGGRIESATEPLDTTTSAGRLARGMLAEFAAFESERIGDGWRETHERRRRAGLPAQGGDRFGYTRHGSAYTPHPQHGIVLASMYRRFLDGEGFTRIVRWLNDTGVTTTTGGIWDRSRVTRVLDSGFGAGQIIHGRGPKAQHYPGIHPAVITAGEWAAYRERRALAPEPPRNVDPQYFLSGIVKCGDCGAPMHSANERGQRTGYVCSRWSRTKTGRCVTASRPRVEAFVLAWLHEFADNVEARAADKVRDTEERVIAVNDAAAIERSIVNLDRKLATLTTRYLEGKIPEAAYAATSAKLQGEHDSLSSRLTTATRRSTSILDLSTVRPTLDQWQRMTVLEQRNFTRTLITAVRVIPPPEIRRGGTSLVTFEIVPRFAPV